MLQIVTRLRDLDFRQLMDVYEEMNRLNGKAQYPALSSGAQLIQAEQDFYGYLQECFFPTEGAFYAVWSPEGRYAAALRMEPYRDGLLLAALETAPQARGKGYAKALVKAVQAYLSEKKPGVVYAHVEKRNLPSLTVHYACGFQKISDNAIYIDGSVLRSSVTLKWESKK